MNERELKQECKDWAYAMGYAVLGDGVGGLITTLLQRKGLRQTRSILSAAAKKADRKAYIGGILRDATDDLNKVEVGTRMGLYEWDGGKWKRIESA